MTAQEAIDTVFAGNLVDCTAAEYHAEIRKALQSQAGGSHELWNWQRIALDALEELERRGNRGLEGARLAVSYFHADVLGIRCRMEALDLGDRMRAAEEVWE